MNSTKFGVSILVLITLGALGFAAFSYFNRPGTTPLPSASPIALTTSTPSSALESPVPSTSPTTSATPAPTRTLTAKQPLSVPNEVATIELGSSLFAVASSNGLRVSDLTTINGITNADTVQAGQTLIIPDDVSGDTYTILFVLNKTRLTKEEQKVKDGGTSLYGDAIGAAQIDTKGIYGLSADTPFSKSNETEKSVTLSTSDDTRIATVTMEKTDTGLWYVKKLVIKISKAPSPSPSPWSSTFQTFCKLYIL